jgi:hypothetical protein
MKMMAVAALAIGAALTTIITTITPVGARSVQKEE